MNGIQKIIISSITLLFSSLTVLPISSAIAPSPAGIVSVAWSPDGNRIAGAGTNGFLRVWDAASNQILLDVKGMTHYFHSVTWNPDSAQIAVAAEDGIIRIWNVATGEMTASISR